MARKSFKINGDFIVVGDIHGKPGVSLAKIEKEYSAVNNIFFLGDIGVGFTQHNYKPISKISKRMVGINPDATIWVLRGNHDNPSFYNLYHHKHQIETRYPNVKILNDFDTLEFDDGKTGIVIPGAVSVDRFMRYPGADWWKDEIPAYQLLDEVDGHFDYLFSHGGLFPLDVPVEKTSSIEIFKRYDHDLNKDLEEEKNFWLKVLEKYTPEKWFLGHFHFTHEESRGGTSIRYCNIDEVVKQDE